ncbi:Transcriptional regulator, MarR family [Alloactinosynnema sp. L-07]|uniref:MarR family winged helix-turn-helix transcriptional regulator n=1 Tax=Alloactinosynnema sp. L-07 TaxID=1653480 RepID=UPI00065F00F9|nr:MarR family winged helix-turn-helix transcriptional regulator [Alloactinosynnema sp. L-07]CRK55142.1 Transcriptional regulator, MarR family [Alloactinosynnema sp. L-07]
MTEPDISTLLDDAYRALEAELHRQLDAAGFADIRPAHGKVFETIGQDGNRLTAMAEQARITKGAMAELVDYLEARGYVQRAPDPRDGRAKIVRLTPRGWEAVQVAAAAIVDVEDRWQAGLGPRRMATLRRALAEMPGLLTSVETLP